MSSKNRKVYQMGLRSSREFFSSPTRYLAEAISKESEFEKPYLDLDREKMHLDFPWPDWPPFGDIPPWPPLPEIPGPTPGLSLCGITCYKPLSDCDEPIWCHPSIWCGADLQCNLCSWMVEGAISGYSKHEGPGGGIDIWIDKELVIDGKALVHAQMTDPCGNLCGRDIEVTCKECPPEISISWDSGELTVGRNSNVGVAIKDGLGPYSWSVAGTGFSMANATTSGVGNTLNTDGIACGTATITVTDDCGETTTGYVRCTVGTWSEIPFTSCVIGGAITEGDGRTRIEKKWKLVEDWDTTCSTSGSGCTHDTYGLCGAAYYTWCHCTETIDCHTTMGCIQCLEHGGICNIGGYAHQCGSGSCYCCVTGGDCDAISGNPAVAMCSQSTSKLYEWVC